MIDRLNAASSSPPETAGRRANFSPHLEAVAIDYKLGSSD